MNKNSKVLALKYRPQTFDDLIGQEVVAETIKNAIKLNKTPNAYLFTGIRGIGKTTTARIVAKSLNCLNGPDKLCKDDFCENCEAISNSSHIDVLEMDAASKTGVDDVRDLIEFSRYGPTSAKYKIFIIDEVHMLSKQAFNALLKTLEEPPEYLKFIFATTEIKKIPITVVSRCQRFDLSRIKSSELFEFIKKIKDKENGKELDLISAQSIFGYFDKSQLIDLFKLILEGNEDEVIKIYRKIYDQGIEPKVFINDFLELIYYFKNINFLTLESTNFTLNDEEFSKIKEISNTIDSEVLILFWQFTIKTLEELDIVSSQHLSIEMFLIRLMHLSGIKQSNEISLDKNLIEKKISTIDNNDLEVKPATQILDQIKNITQEKKAKPLINDDVKATDALEINSFEDLLNICTVKKEIKLKYELEKNVNLVRFDSPRIEISFNDNLDKDFVKDLSTKLYDWTNKRWIITFSKSKGQMSVKEKEKNLKKELIDKAKQSELYKKVMEKFPDAELVDVKFNNKEEDND